MVKPGVVDQFGLVFLASGSWSFELAFLTDFIAFIFRYVGDDVRHNFEFLSMVG